MSYINASQVLPPSVIELIQTYFEGDYLYIPKREAKKAPWGTHTDTRAALAHRNQCIYREHLDGATTADLAQRYYLSIKSIQRIVAQERACNG